MEKVQKRKANRSRSRRRLNRTSRRFRITRILSALRKKRPKARIFKIPQPMLQVASQKVNLDPYTDTKNISLRNLSDKSQLDWYVAGNSIPNWLTINPASGSLAANSSTTIAVTADESNLSNGLVDHVINLKSNGGDVNVKVFTNVGNPDADPSALSFSHETTNSFYLEWTNNCTNETEVRIYQATANLKPVSPTYTEVPGSGFTHKVISGVLPGVTYYFWVEFANLDGVSNHSTGNKTLPDPPNADPVNMTFSHITTDTIYVHWDNNCTNEDEVRFWYSIINVQPANYETLSANAIEKQLSGILNAGTTYYFWVQFVNSDGSSTTLTGNAGTTGATTIVTYLNEAFDGTTNGYSQVPSNWATPLGLAGVVYPGTPKSMLATRKWTCDAFRTPSSFTGPSSGHDSTASDGREGSSTSDFMFTETSGQYSKRFLLRTPELNFSNTLSNNTLKLTFWFHMYGANIGSLGVAATDSATSAGSEAEVVSGSGFTSDTAGGLTMVYWDDNSDDGSSTSSGVRITGEQQTAGHGSTSVDAHWRKATIDLNALAGESSVYIWLFAKSSTSWKGDISIDDVKVIGEE